MMRGFFRRRVQGGPETISSLARLLVWFAMTLVAASMVQAGKPKPTPTPTPTPTPSSPEELTQLYNTATAAFAAGDYAAAAAGLEKVIAQAPPDSQLEGVYYTLGAAYFNLGQYPKAAEILQTYLKKFPNGARMVEASFCLGQASLMNHDTARAIEAFKALENNPGYREQAILYEARAQKEAGKTDEAIATLEKLLAGGIRTNATANGALTLAGLYAEKKQVDKTLALVTQVRANIRRLDNIVQFNALAVEMGDSLLQQRLPEGALSCYRTVQTQSEVIELQKSRIDSLQGEIARQIAAARADPSHAAQLLSNNALLRTAVTEGTQRLADFRKLPDFMPALLMRIATCYAQTEHPWEAITAYDELLRRYPDNADTREPALYGTITASINVNRLGKVPSLGERYLKEFPQGPNADTVGYLMGSVALQQNDVRGAETYFGRLLEASAPSTYAEKMRYLLGNAQFSLGEYDKARETYAKYQTEFATGAHREEVDYRTALCAVFSGEYEKAMGLLNAYTKTYPQGDFVPDALYRLAVCLYAASQNDEVIASCQAWEKRFGEAQMLGEVLALQGDALASKNDNATAVDAYLRACKVATTDAVSDYAIFAAQKLLQKTGDWDRIGQIFEDFVREHPDRPSAVMGVYWIGKARAHQGKPEEAKKFIAGIIKQYIADPDRDAVEQLLTQLASLCVRKKTPPPAPVIEPSSSGDPAVAVTAQPEPTATPAPTAVADSKPVDPSAELDKLLGGTETDASPLARARVLFAKSELARLRRQTAVQEQNLELVATNFKPEDLSAPLLAAAGDHLLDKGRFELAAPMFDRLMSVYPKSNLLDFAYHGLGEIAYQNKDYLKALRLFTEAVDKAGATAKLKEVTVGRAKTLLALERLDDAKPVFEQVASTREWRGESTAYAVYSLGDIMRRQGKLPEAIIYYQRVFVAYQRYLPWVAKAYIASAECFEQLGKNQEAINTYREMLKNPKLQDFEEARAARTHLQKIGQG